MMATATLQRCMASRSAVGVNRMAGSRRLSLRTMPRYGLPNRSFSLTARAQTNADGIVPLAFESYEPPKDKQAACDAGAVVLCHGLLYVC